MSSGKAFSRKRRLLVVGNGPTGIAADGRFEVDLTCGHFLLDVAALGNGVQFLQPVEPLELTLNYYGFVLEPKHVEVIGLDRRTALAALRTCFISLRAIVRADFIYLFFPGRLPGLVGRLCRTLGKRYAVYVRGERFFPTGPDGDLLRNAAFVLAASEGIASRIASLNHEVSLIRPMSTVSSDEALRRDFFLRRSGPLRLLFVGRLEADKGVLDLLAAAELLRREGIEFELRLVGWGNLYTKLAQQFSDPSASIFVLGGIEDRSALMRMYEEADVFVLPSHHEGFPRVLYEAMSKSAVVVTTMVGGIPSLLRHEENCLAVPVGDAAAIAAAITRLAQSPALMQRLAEAALLAALEVLESRPTHAQVLQRKLDATLNETAERHGRRRSSSARARQNESV